MFIYFSFLLTVHENKKEHSCTTCGKTYSTKSALNEHNRKVHQGLSGKIKRPTTKDFACEDCGKLFYFEGNLIFYSS